MSHSLPQTNTIFNNKMSHFSQRYVSLINNSCAKIYISCNKIIRGSLQYAFFLDQNVNTNAERIHVRCAFRVKITETLKQKISM